MLYCKGSVPPLPKAVMVPLFCPQVADAGIALSNIAGLVAMVTKVLFVQLAASLTVRMYCPATNPVKKFPTSIM